MKSEKAALWVVAIGAYIIICCIMWNTERREAERVQAEKVIKIK